MSVDFHTFQTDSSYHIQCNIPTLSVVSSFHEIQNTFTTFHRHFTNKQAPPETPSLMEHKKQFLLIHKCYISQKNREYPEKRKHEKSALRKQSLFFALFSHRKLLIILFPLG